MSNRVALSQRLPAFSVPHLNAVTLNMLAIVEPFHREAMIETDRLGKISFKNRMMRAGRSGPEGGGIAVHCRLSGLESDMLLSYQIHGITLVDGSSELSETIVVIKW